MSRKIIPTQVTVTCDECGVTDKDRPFKMKAMVTFNGSALDMYGDPAASADFSFDLCDECALKFYREWRPKA